MIICIIPARSGSKRIPGKNSKKFLGKPIISYSIENAINSGLFDRVIVSTDSEAKAEISSQCGAEIPFMRPKHLSDDFSNTNDVMKHAIKWLQDDGEKIKFVCCLYPTTPLLDSSYLKVGLELLQTNNNKSFAFSVCKYSSPIQRSFQISNDNIQMLFPDNSSLRTQDLNETYHDAGQFYWGLPDAFLQDKNIFSASSIPVLLPKNHVVDIDNIEDWDWAETIFTARSFKNSIT